jgi:hypothetical protein
MKLKSLSLVVVLLVLLLIGCAVKTPPATNVPPAPQVQGCKLLANGACDPVDVQAFRIIADAWAFLGKIRSAQAGGTMTPLNASQKSIFNDVVLAYNTAYTLGVAYHGGASSDAAGLTAATNNLSTKLTTASTQIVAPSSNMHAPAIWGEVNYQEGL